MEGVRYALSSIRSRKNVNTFSLRSLRRTTFAGAKDWFDAYNSRHEKTRHDSLDFFMVGVDGIEPSTKWL